MLRSLTSIAVVAAIALSADTANATEGAPEPAACNDGKFKAAITKYNYKDRGTPDFRLNQVVGSSAYFAPYSASIMSQFACIGGPCTQLYYYKIGRNRGSVWQNVDRYATRVAFCRFGDHPHFSDDLGKHIGPIVRISYRKPGQQTWTLATITVFSKSDVGKAVAWHFHSGRDWDWFTSIELSAPGDVFDIGHAVKDCQGKCPPERQPGN